VKVVRAKTRRRRKSREHAAHIEAAKLCGRRRSHRRARDRRGGAVSVFERATLRLTHYGRKSGKPYCVTLWFAVLDGRVCIGSLSRKRAWVRNVRALGRADLDFGAGPRSARCRWVEDPEMLERYSRAVLSKYPIRARLVLLVSPNDRCMFETDVAVA
jgi:deazaflavin-dependent oxidoreductase (nitroreductase family)